MNVFQYAKERAPPFANSPDTRSAVRRVFVWRRVAETNKKPKRSTKATGAQASSEKNGTPKKRRTRGWKIENREALL